MKKRYNIIFSILILFFCFYGNAKAQLVRVVDNKGTIKEVRNNNVTEGGTAPTSPVEADVWFDTTNNAVKIYDESIPGWRDVTAMNWKLTGNAGTNPANNFLGTTDNQDLVLRTNNTEKVRISGTANQVLINSATKYKHFPLIIKAGKNNNLIGFQTNSGTKPQWHINLQGSGLNFVETEQSGYRLFLRNGGRIGINTGNPTHMLDVNGQAKIRTITSGDIGADNIVVASTIGVLRRLPVSSFRSVVAPVVTGGHTIATHTPGTGTGTTNIQETVTSINNTIAGHQIATYADEDGGAETPIRETITTVTNQNTTAQAQGRNSNLSSRSIANYSNEAGGTPTPINETVTSLTQNDTPTSVANPNVTGEITYTNENGNTNTAQVVSANANNSITVGNDGGAYLNLGEIVHVGHFTVSQNRIGTVGDVTVTGLPFRASKITFVAQPNVHIPTSANTTSTGSLGEGFGSGSRIIYHNGIMNGYVNRVGNTITQRLMSSAKSMYGAAYYQRYLSSNEYSIGFSFGDNTGNELAYFRGSVTAISSNSFTIHSVFWYTNNTTRWGYSSADRNSPYRITVMYVAYR